MVTGLQASTRMHDSSILSTLFLYRDRVFFRRLQLNAWLSACFCHAALSIDRHRHADYRVHVAVQPPHVPRLRISVSNGDAAAARARGRFAGVIPAC